MSSLREAPRVTALQAKSSSGGNSGNGTASAQSLFISRTVIVKGFMTRGSCII